MYKFNNYLSLGAACKTRYQLDRFFSKRKPGYQPIKGYFDWLWGGGFDGVSKAFMSNFAIDKEDFVVKNAGGTTQVFNIKTGFYFLHDFVFSKNALLDLSLANLEMAEQLDNFIEKYQYLGSKTIELVRENNLLCLVYIGPVIRESFLKLHDHFDGNLTLLNILPADQNIDMTILDGFEKKWFIRTVDDDVVNGTPNEWMGSDVSFDLAFNDFY